MISSIPAYGGFALSGAAAGQRAARSEGVAQFGMGWIELLARQAAVKAVRGGMPEAAVETFRAGWLRGYAAARNPRAGARSLVSCHNALESWERTR